jgi:DNA-directed RNA polymerase
LKISRPATAAATVVITTIQALIGIIFFPFYLILDSGLSTFVYMGGIFSNYAMIEKNVFLRRVGRMDKKTIQLRLQSSDMSNVLQLSRKDYSVKMRVVKKYLKPLASEIFQNKLDDFPAMGKKLFASDKIAEALQIDTLGRNDINIFFRDIVRFAEHHAKEEYERTKSRKLKQVDAGIYRKALEKYANDLKRFALTINDTLANIRVQSPQIVALALFPIPSEELAYIALNVLLLLDDIKNDTDIDEDESLPNTLAIAARNLGEAVAEQLWFVKERGWNSKRRSKAEYARLKEMARAVRMDSDYLLPVGLHLLKMTEHCGISARYQMDDDGEEINYIDNVNNAAHYETKALYKSPVRVRLSDEFAETIEKIRNELLQEAALHYDPMVIEPIPWQDGYTGGFLPESPRYVLPLRKVQTKKERVYFEKIASNIPPAILNAINTIQSTPFRINENVYAYLEKRYEILSEMLKKKRKEINDALYDLKRAYKDAQKAYEAVKKTDIAEAYLVPIRDDYLKKKAAYKQKARTLLGSVNPLAEEVSAISRKLRVVRRLLKAGHRLCEPIWFVYQMDFRGRIYPVQAHLTPQGDDIAKGLLHFYEKKPLDSNGVYWLKVHGANLYGKDGLDKKPFDERVAWVERHETQIVKTAEEPENSELLKEAEDPVQFLAFCFEYREFLKDPQHFKSALPVGVDGSNNGLQHISALYKDTHSAKLVNVLPDESGMPQDIYRAVAEHSKRKIRSDMQSFENEKNKLKQNEEGLYFVEKENTEVLYGNFLSDELTQHVLAKIEELKNVYKIEGEKGLRSFLKKLLNGFLENAGRDQKDRFISELASVSADAAFNPQEIEAFIETEKNEFEKLKRYAYRNEQGYYVESVPSPLNFIDENMLELIDRNLVKPNVMTDSYGTELRSKQDQVFKKLLSLQEKGKVTFKERMHIRILANYIGKINDESINEISKASERYMRWCKKSVGKIYRNGRKKINRHQPITWTTPLGLEVTQVKFKRAESKEIETMFGQDRVTISNKKETDEIDLARQKSGLAPNFIHSLDSTHMFLSINRAKKEGVDAFMTIHDSFATHASDVETLLKALKEEFTALHEQPLMQKLKEELQTRFGVELDDIEYVDEKFDVSDVKRAEYFFA